MVDLYGLYVNVAPFSVVVVSRLFDLGLPHTELHSISGLTGVHIQAIYMTLYLESNGTFSWLLPNHNGCRDGKRCAAPQLSDT